MPAWKPVSFAALALIPCLVLAQVPEESLAGEWKDSERDVVKGAKRFGPVLLALDTSTLTLSLALLEPGGAVREALTVGPPRRTSEVLPGEVDALLKRHALTPKELTALVVGLGPGSFTGLRIGLATIKGLAYALKLPVAGVSSLAAIALEGPEGVDLCCAAVVKKGELYLGRYRREGQTVRALAVEQALALPAFAAEVLAVGGLVLGPAVAEYADRLVELGVQSERLRLSPAVPSAVCLARLANVPAAYDASAMFALEPHYLRGSGAEDNPKFPPLPGPPPGARLKED